MKEIFSEYGSAIITVIVIVALVIIFGVLLKSDGVIATQFQSMISTFFTNAQSNATGITWN